MISTGEAIATIVALASVWAMTGVIWVIQVVHYPIFDSIERGVGDENWRRFGDRPPQRHLLRRRTLHVG